MSEKVPFAHPWNELRIGDLAGVIVGGTPDTSVPQYWGGDVSWMSSGDVHMRRVNEVSGRITETGLNASAAKIVHPPAVAIALAGQGKTRGTAALVNIPLCTNQSVALIKCHSPQVDTGYLFHALEFRYEELRSRSSGGGRAGLTKSIIQRIPLPTPLVVEQTRIAEILDTLDEAIRESESVIEKLRQVKSGLLHDLLTRGLDEHGHLRDPIRHPDQFQDSPLGLIPNAWEAARLGELAAHIGSGVTPTGGSAVYQTAGIMFVRSQNVSFEGLILDDVAYISTRTHQAMLRSEILPFDVLLNITGASIGRCCFVPADFGPANVNQHVCAIRLPKPRFEDGVFLAAVLASAIGQSQIDRLNAGGNREGLNYAQVRSFFVPWPPQEERQAVARCLQETQKRITAEEQNFSKLQSLKHGLSHDLLTGRKRVKV